MVNDEATSSSKNESTTSVDNCGNQQTEANFNRPLRWFKLGEIIWFFNEVRKWYLTRTWTSLDDGLGSLVLSSGHTRAFFSDYDPMTPKI